MPKFAELEVLAQKVDQVAKAEMIDLKLLCSEIEQLRTGSPLQALFVRVLPIPSNYPSTVTASGFSESSIFDLIHHRSLLREGRSLLQQSVTSFATSMGDGLDYGQRRIPNLPESHEFGFPFQCQFCGDVQRNVQNRADWK